MKKVLTILMDAVGAVVIVFAIGFLWELYWNVPHQIRDQSNSIAPPPLPSAPMPPPYALNQGASSRPIGAVSPTVQPFFKDSPVFTTSNRAIVTGEINKFHDYLTTVGFQPPTEIPPVGSMEAAGGLVGGTFTRESLHKFCIRGLID